MKGGYESLVWINDKAGKEYVCNLDDIHNKNDFDKLTDEEKRHCADVSQIVGTERW